MKIKTILYTVAFGAAIGFPHSAPAAEHHSKALTDAVFAKKAAAGGLTEVELGKLAQQNGDSQDVKDFGAKMVSDHGKANDNLKAIAAKDSLTIPDKPTADQQEMIDKLTKETGKAFDRDYIHAMVRAHIGDKALFTKESADAKNPDLKQFASDTLQVVTEHLAMIEGIADAHGIASNHHHMKATAMAPMSAASSGDSGAGKSGLDPGANGNPAPVASPAASDMSAPPAPSTGDSGAGKSGLAPGATGNPAPQPQ